MNGRDGLDPMKQRQNSAHSTLSDNDSASATATERHENEEETSSKPNKKRKAPDEITVLDVMDAMFQQRQILLRQQQELFTTFLKHPTDRHDLYGESEQPINGGKYRSERSLIGLNILTRKISDATKDLRKTQEMIEEIVAAED